ncbi:2-amino-4-hydroxy-6-hydroxymethyldihydropteridine diphosphokinase [Odoribacter lunatus]|uniref:2-amino-4-hydroxy-6- hydroxymethyldihydropteridine diphosphokinase n=1 Tax=Odoribacter lunatus TaxID=2941335 RepID=UPI0020412805|nr:2-amino-4-hydroxy-6-hydroxymethyldihydropteridine diphosphokinase [Odoribacter lunatus]
MLTTVILGSNSGNKAEYIKQATRLLTQQCGQLTVSSSLYETAPWGFECNESFLNQVLQFETELQPEIFLQQSLVIEKSLGRIRSSEIRYASRTIDIDLLFCDDKIIHTPTLTLPHPRIAERRFVLAPLHEVMPDFVHPLFHKTITQLLSECNDSLSVKIITTTI